MTSPSPLLYDTYYHIYNRGVNRDNIFIEERNYEYFMQLYAKYIEPVAATYAYCLLKNHFHVLIRVKPEQEIRTLRVSETLRVLPSPVNTWVANPAPPARARCWRDRR